jgi:two-component system, NtrC family, response regulator AtoC
VVREINNPFNNFHNKGGEMGRILVVDDEEDICKTLRDVFKGEGYEVEITVSGKEAIEKVKVRVPDLILLDVRMPEMNGVEVLKAIRNIDKNVPVAMITAYEDVDLAEEALRLGAYDYVKKPFDLEYLLASVLSKILPENGRSN